MTPTRVFAAGGFSFFVRSDMTEFRLGVERLFVDLPDGPTAGASEYVAAMVDGRLVLEGPNLDTFGFQPANGAALGELVWAINRSNLDVEQELLHLHAAGVVVNGTGMVLVAPSGTGKSTLAAALARAGHAYLSDEAVAISADSDDVSGFAKPISLKHTGHHLFRDVAEHAVEMTRGGTRLWQIPASALGAPIVRTLRPASVVFLERRSRQRLASHAPISKADAVVHLVENCQDFERFGSHALLRLGRLAAGAHCVRVDVGSVDATVELIEDLSRRPSPVETPVSAHRSGLPGFSSSVQVLFIGDEAVLHDTGTGRLASLNAAGREAIVEASQPGVLPAEFADALSSAGFI